MSRTTDRFRSAAGLVVPRMQGEKLETNLDEFRRMVRDGFRCFIIFGARLPALRNAIRELEREARAPLLVLSDLEQGVGQQVDGGMLIPSAMSLAHAIDRENPEDQELFRQLFSLVSREARLAGVNVILAPVADLHLNEMNPIICTRAYGSDPAEVAWFTQAHVRALQENPPERAVLACAKHFPGHGRTDADSHLHLPVIAESLDILRESDLVPFRAAIGARCGMIMMGHLLIPALDPERPTSRSARVVHGLLRKELGYDGIVVTDAMNMAGASGNADATTASLQAFQAGCDLILHPPEPYAVVDILTANWGTLEPRIMESTRRVREAVHRLDAHPGVGTEPGPASETDEIRRIVNLLVPRSLRVVKGQTPVPGIQHLVVLDEDQTLSNGKELERRLREASPKLQVHRPEGSDRFNVDPFRNRDVVIALFSKISGWKGRSGMSPWREELLRRAVGEARRSVVISFGCPSLLLPAQEADTLVQAWWVSPVAESAVAKLLCGNY